MRRPLLAGSAVVCLAMSLSACGSDQSDVAAASSAPEDMTPRALAAAVAAQLPDAELVAAHVDKGGDSDEEDALRVDLTFDADGSQTRVTVVATDDPGDFPGRHPCQTHGNILDGCLESTGPDGSSSVLLWKDKSPDEGPGIVDVVSVRPEALVWAEYDGIQAVTGDPRDLDLAVPVNDMLAAVSDPSVGLDAGPDQLRAGDDLGAWRG
jgi:hypothetical protein